MGKRKNLTAEASDFDVPEGEGESQEQSQGQEQTGETQLSAESTVEIIKGPAPTAAAPAVVDAAPKRASAPTPKPKAEVKAEKPDFDPGADHVPPAITAQNMQASWANQLTVQRTMRVEMLARGDEDIRWLLEENARLSAELAALKNEA